MARPSPGHVKSPRISEPGNHSIKIGYGILKVAPSKQFAHGLESTSLGLPCKHSAKGDSITLWSVQIAFFLLMIMVYIYQYQIL